MKKERKKSVCVWIMFLEIKDEGPRFFVASKAICRAFLSSFLLPVQAIKISFTLVAVDLGGDKCFCFVL